MSGLRETKKAEKRREIQRAVLEALAEKGFERTTTREIAERAGVAEGTLFLYAQNKTDLFLLAINDDLDRLAEVAVDDRQSLVDQIVAVLTPRYAFWARHPDLYLAAVREMSSAYMPRDPQGDLAQGIGRRADTLRRLTEILRRSAAAGRLRPAVDVDAVARVVLDVYLTELRFWLCEDRPALETGIARLRRLLESLAALIRR